MGMMMRFEGSVSRGGGEEKGDHRNCCDGGGWLGVVVHGLPAGGGANRTYKGKDVEEGREAIPSQTKKK